MVRKTKQLPDVIILNGTSSAGKSSLARTLCKEFGENSRHVELDGIMRAVYTGLMPRRVGVRAAFIEAIRASADKGDCVIADAFYDKPLMRELQQALREYKVVAVAVKASLKELQRREKQRGDREIGLAESQYAEIHKGIKYDLEIDTTRRTPQQAALALLKKLGHF